MSITTGFAGVSNCYVFKSRLQEYSQKAGFVTPVYETVKDGPSHQPCFRSTVTVNDVRYDSLPGFFNRKAAEQSAAEVALLELAKSGNSNKSISHPVHETGLCKNLLQEYAQKMNFAIPSYISNVDDAPGRTPSFSCTVDIGGILYIGAAAKTKKEAEIKAARTALLAIQSNTNGAQAKPDGSPHLTVLPGEKKGGETLAIKVETEKPLKPKKASFKNRPRKKYLQNKVDLVTGNVVESSSGLHQVVHAGALDANKDGHGGEPIGSQLNQNQQVFVTETNNNFQHGQTTTSNFNPSDQRLSNMDLFSEVQITLPTEVNNGAGVVQVAQTGVAEVLVAMGDTFGPKNSLVGLNQYEDGRKVVEAENVQRIEDPGLSLYRSVD